MPTTGREGRWDAGAPRRENPAAASTRRRTPGGATGIVGDRAAAPASGPAAFLARMPRPRLTALGGGLMALAVMLGVGFTAALLLDGSMTFYGVCFLMLCGACALWVRVIDVLAVPVVVPIAFAVGLVPMGGDEGVGAWLVELATTLAVNVGWLYSGTLVAALITVVRRIIYAARRRRGRRSSARPA